MDLEALKTAIAALAPSAEALGLGLTAEKLNDAAYFVQVAIDRAAFSEESV